MLAPGLRFALALSTFVLSSACGGAATNESATPTRTVGAVPSLTMPVASADGRSGSASQASADPFGPDRVPQLTPIDRTAHEQAVAAYRAGHLVPAKRLFAQLAVSYPNDPVLFDQYTAVEKRIAEVQRLSAESLVKTELRVLDRPPFAQATVKPAPVPSPTVPKLAITSQKKNEITDEEKWFEENDLRLADYFVPSWRDVLFAPLVIKIGDLKITLDKFQFEDTPRSRRFSAAPLPAAVPLNYGTLRLTRVIDSSPYTVAIYGKSVLAVFDKDMLVTGLFDFQNWLYPPASQKKTVSVGSFTMRTPDATAQGSLTTDLQTVEVPLMYAFAEGGVLYVSQSNLGYAKESKGQNAYVAALDVSTGALYWQSAPLVANARNFVLSAGALVTGYGFTAEPDFVYVLDRATGATKQKLAVKSGPEYVVTKQGRFHVRTYDTDYVLEAR